MVVLQQLSPCCMLQATDDEAARLRAEVAEAKVAAAAEKRNQKARVAELEAAARTRAEESKAATQTLTEEVAELHGQVEQLEREIKWSKQVSCGVNDCDNITYISRE